MSGKSHITPVNSIGIGLVNLVLFLALIPPYGIEGGECLAVALSMCILCVVRVIEGHKIIGVHPFAPGYVKPLIACGVSLAITLLIDPSLPGNRYLFPGSR